MGEYPFERVMTFAEYVEEEEASSAPPRLDIACPQCGLVLRVVDDDVTVGHWYLSCPCGFDEVSGGAGVTCADIASWLLERTDVPRMEGGNAMSAPPQSTIPDDLVPNARGYTREQLAIRTLAEVVADLVSGLTPMPMGAAGRMLAVTTRRQALADVFALTEPEVVKREGHG